MDSFTEVFRLTPVIGKAYKHAECTHRTGIYPKTQYFAPTANVKDVGTLIEIQQGGFGDGAWRKDVYDNDGKTTIVEYSYEGNTCFIEIK